MNEVENRARIQADHPSKQQVKDESLWRQGRPEMAAKIQEKHVFSSLPKMCPRTRIKRELKSQNHANTPAQQQKSGEEKNPQKLILQKLN